MLFGCSLTECGAGRCSLTPLLLGSCCVAVRSWRKRTEEIRMNFLDFKEIRSALGREWRHSRLKSLKETRMNNIMKERDASKALGVSVSTLRRWRLLGNGPVFRKLNGAVRYAAPDLQKFIDDRARVSTVPHRHWKEGTGGKPTKYEAKNVISSLKGDHADGSV
jgi:hypothetical protein